MKPAPQAREREGMRVRWQDRWAGQGGAGEGYLISGSSWTLPEELPTGLRAPELPLLPECTGSAGVFGPALTRHFRLLSDWVRSRFRPFHEPRAVSASPNPSRLHPPKRSRPRPVPTPKGVLSPYRVRGEARLQAPPTPAPARPAPRPSVPRRNVPVARHQPYLQERRKSRDFPIEPT